MVLKPTTSPPQARTPPDEPPASPPAFTKALAPQPPKSFQVYNENADQQHPEQTGFLKKLKVPAVLETPSVSHTMAAAPASPPASTKAVAPQPSKSFQVYNENAGQQHPERTGFLARLKVPTVVLETPSVSHTMAAALSLSLLNHTLFLKNQVPLYVQLYICARQLLTYTQSGRATLPHAGRQV